MQAHAGATTVTVTHKGSVIVRFSWSDTVPWDPLLADSLLFACEALSRLLADCV